MSRIIFCSFKIVEIDNVLGYLMNKLTEAGLLDKMNILVVSDHGMAEMHTNLLLSDIVDENLVDKSKTVLNIVSSVYPRNPKDVFMLFSVFLVFLLNFI